MVTRLLAFLVVLLAVDEHDDVGVLLDRAGLAQVGELRPLVLAAIEGMMRWKDEMSALHGRAEVIIGKQRHGPIGTIELAFEGEFTRFSNLVRPFQQAPDADFR